MLFSCSENSEKISEDFEKSEEISFGMEEVVEDTTDLKLANITWGFTLVENDSLKLQIHFEDLPDSILFNDSNIKEGFFQYALALSYPNIDSTKHDNLVFELFWNNLNEDLPEKNITFQEFLNKCWSYSQIQSSDEKQRIKKSIESPLNTKIINNTIIISSPVRIYQDYLSDYFFGKFSIHSTYNEPEVKGENNFYIDRLSSEENSEYYFHYPYSRIIDSRKIDSTKK